MRRKNGLLGAAAIAVWLVLKLEEIRDRAEMKRLYKSIGNGVYTPTSFENFKQLFTVSPKEILLGENVINQQGKNLKKISSIKDAPTRLAAQNNAKLSFSIDMNNGDVYKVLNLEGKCFYYKIDYTELKRYLLMNESAYKRYRSIDNTNWQELCR